MIMEFCQSSKSACVITFQNPGSLVVQWLHFWNVHHVQATVCQKKQSFVWSVHITESLTSRFSYWITHQTHTHTNTSHLNTSVEPVKATLLMSMWLAIAAPAVGPKPGIMFTTPGGNPACNTNKNTVTQSKALKVEIGASPAWFFLMSLSF